jgi:phosphatidylserine decarboxylase
MAAAMHQPMSAEGRPAGPERLSPGRRLFVALQYALPQHALSGLMFRLTRLRLGPLTGLAIRVFAQLFRVDLREAAEPAPRAYASFNAFFTRALREDARPMAAAPDALLSPVDGTVSQAGRVDDERLIQAKGRGYGLGELLGGDEDLTLAFRNGSFATLYLSPRDYHRIHMPVDGRLRRMIHVPGRLFSVNPTTVAGVPRLFARNERVICLFETAFGPVAVILVGAIFVGSIETAWAGRITPPRGRRISNAEYGDEGPVLARGAELGRFNMGSTVILLIPSDSVRWSPDLAPEATVHCRSRIGTITAAC